MTNLVAFKKKKQTKSPPKVIITSTRLLHSTWQLKNFQWKLSKSEFLQWVLL